LGRTWDRQEASADRRAARTAGRVAGLTMAHGRIVEIDVLADPARLRELDLASLDD
jgi:hypothetical protein